MGRGCGRCVMAAEQSRPAHERAPARTRRRGAWTVRALAELDASGVKAVLFDIDETLTTAGKLTAEAYAALERLKLGGKRVVPVTGRPAGWCDHIARMWPVDAVVGENGAFYFWFAGGKLGKRFIEDAPTRARNRAELLAIGERILKQVPGAALASDQPYRET